MASDIDCSPEALVADAKCFCGVAELQRDWVKVYLLQQIAGLGAKTPEELVELAKCFGGVSPKQLKQIEVYLLCQILS